MLLVQVGRLHSSSRHFSTDSLAPVSFLLTLPSLPLSPSQACSFPCHCSGVAATAAVGALAFHNDVVDLALVQPSLLRPSLLSPSLRFLSLLNRCSSSLPFPFLIPPYPVFSSLLFSSLNQSMRSLRHVLPPAPSLVHEHKASTSTRQAQQQHYSNNTHREQKPCIKPCNKTWIRGHKRDGSGTPREAAPGVGERSADHSLKTRRNWIAPWNCGDEPGEEVLM